MLVAARFRFWGLSASGVASTDVRRSGGRAGGATRQDGTILRTWGAAVLRPYTDCDEWAAVALGVWEKLVEMPTVQFKTQRYCGLGAQHAAPLHR